MERLSNNQNLKNGLENWFCKKWNEINGEKVHKICCIMMCFMPIVIEIISFKLGIPNNIKKLMWLVLLGADIALIGIAFKISKNTKRRERVFGIVGLILLVAYTLYFALI